MLDGVRDDRTRSGPDLRPQLAQSPSAAIDSYSGGCSANDAAPAIRPPVERKTRAVHLSILVPYIERFGRDFTVRRIDDSQ